MGQGGGENQGGRGTAAKARRLSFILALVLALAALALLAGPLLLRLPGLFADRARLAETVRAAGAWGPLCLIGLALAQVILAPVPGQAVGFVAGYLYGFWQGGLYCWLGLVLGSAAAMTLARVAGRPLVERLVDGAALARLDRLATGRGLLFFLLIFLLPFLPDDLACFAAGLTALPLRRLLLVAAAGRIPGLVAAVWLGAYAEDLTWPAWLAIALLSAASLVVAWRGSAQIERAVLGCDRTGAGDDKP